MKNIFLGAFVLAVAALSACDSSQPSGDLSSDSAATSTPAVAQPAVVSTPADTSSAAVPSTQPPVQVSTSGDSASAIQVSPPVQVTPQVQVSPQAPGTQQAVVTPPGMSGKPNPAHGQPGHSCAIPVGQVFP